MNYQTLLTSPQWQFRRLQIFERDKWTCQKCNDHMNRTLHVHHFYYIKNRHPWDYPDNALVTLCDLCHMKEEFIKWVLKTGMKVLRELYFEPADISEIYTLVTNNLRNNNHDESAKKYMEDIKRLMAHD